jgi:hypothetical protein
MTVARLPPPIRWIEILPVERFSWQLFVYERGRVIHRSREFNSLWMAQTAARNTGLPVFQLVSASASPMPQGAA